MDNTVIKVLNPEHGKKVKEYFSLLGFDKGDDFDFAQYPYAGVIDGEWSGCQKAYFKFNELRVIELPEEKSFVFDQVEIKEDYDFINPNHYKQFSVEVIDMVERIWGKEITAAHCEISAFCYRMRMGDKPEQSIERDLEKVKWYLNKANELKNR